MRNIVIVGGSVAAVAAADALRQLGHDGAITVLSDETHAPYVRPPLSKAILKGSETPDSAAIGIDDGIDLRLDAKATGIDLSRNRVIVDGGEEVAFDGLVIASGARARRVLSDHTESVLRDLGDAIELRSRLESARSMLVVGGGFLGMEIASTARSLGLDVTVIDMVSHLERQFGPYLAERMTTAATAHGVRLVVDPGGVDFLDTRPLTGVRASDGTVYEADLVVSAVGDVPNVEWLELTGLATAAGVPTDSRCRVTERIVAAGDVAIVQNDRSGARRTPHWGAAIDQARVAASALLQGDAAEPYRARPYFWTEQWGLDMKICGTIGAGDAECIEGSWEEGSAVIRFRDAHGPVAAVTVNRRMPIPALRKLATAER
ncbi:NAD(P)/FAD-dependent oxidoreductase [Microbacterium sp.]|uniref:NAD(P)/FAD-dependent oxidoreductase n=1 Tax=Microbacterium sp. TaxID=51671 RepID=UPI003A84F3C3